MAYWPQHLMRTLSEEEKEEKKKKQYTDLRVTALERSGSQECQPIKAISLASALIETICAKGILSLRRHSK